MAQNQNPSMDGYHAAMEWLFDHRPHMMEYIASLGAPKNDLRCDRAMVVAGVDGKPKLYANDEFLQKIGPAQAAGVLVHEWRHVLLGHLEEVRNPKPHWKYPIVLRDAHEATINDNIELAGYFLPEDVIRGEHRGGHFYGYWTTDDAYGPMEEWYLSQQQNSEQDGDSEEEGEGSGSSSSSSGQSGSGSSSGQSSAGSSSSGGSSDQGEDSEGSDSGATSGSQDDEDTSADAGASDSTQPDADSESADGQDSSAGSPSEPSDTEDGGAGDKLPNEDASSDGCHHGAYIEDENGDLREMTDQELEDFIDELNRTVADTVRKNPMPQDEKPSENELDQMDQDVAEAIDPSRNGGFSKAGTAASEAEQVLAGGKLHLGWLKLLQRINPDVGKDDGGLNAKASYNWARPRRTTSLIRGVHLPTPGAPRGEGAGAKHKPIALIALDFSGSIDRRLANAMKDMAQSIPEQHIEARCFTFSTYALPFDFKADRNSVAGGGTDFSCIELEARKIQAETGQYPYVICLTDGEAWFEGVGGGYYGTSNHNATKPTQEQLNRNWLWVDVLTEDDSRAFKSQHAYSQVKSQRNLSALPYNRSKL